MKPLTLLLAFFTAIPLTAADKETWTTFQPPYPITFSALFPVPPDRREGKDEWRAMDSSGRVYSAGYGLYTEPQITNPRSFMEKTITALARNTHAQVTYRWFFKYQKVPACEFKLVHAKEHQVAVTRYFLVNQWFYYLDYVTSDKDKDLTGMKKFFESFQILNPGLKDFSPSETKEPSSEK
jgi:hypothetical protein